MIGIVDYEAGNLRSVETAMKHLGADFFISRNPEELLKADRMIFPGVGEAKSSMEVLERTGLDKAVREFADSGKPMLGICLGCQIFFEHSEERDTECLGIIPGRVKEFSADMGLKVPHMGWNQVRHEGRHPVFEGIKEESSFYFVHSFYPSAPKEFEIGSTEYGIGFTSAASKDNVVATQFHPEKSGEVGLKLITNFINWKI
ncbi:MAG: imidazole glycerol phosphate synthase subunit HisH [Spirochaetales bacterium]|uniref:Imidazole glycerol phosphate synthase subunit HisH n=1 Tax=Candidatus Thalassospirochaeta sargassi TaxID=3119039 RepID=A0AAJ1IHQ8_9SPIO|nr:imidazole glycerol phosphate synthase subunit HisH [Spirochaetales bacterium]